MTSASLCWAKRKALSAHAEHAKPPTGVLERDGRGGAGENGDFMEVMVKRQNCQVSWLFPVIPMLGMLKQEDGKL